MTAHPWPVEHARAWCERELGDVPIPLANEADFRSALRNWDYAEFKIDRAVAEVYAAAEAIPPDMQKPHQSALVAELVKEFEAFDSAIDAAQRQYHNCQQWTSAELDPINEARHRFYVAAEAVTHDPIDDLLEKLAEEARAVPEGNTFHGGGLDGAPIFDAYRFAEKTIRRLTGKEAR